MQYKSTFAAVSLISSALASSEPWSTLTPGKPAPSGAVTDYTKTFGIAVVPLTSASASMNKRDVASQIGDGQVQASTATPKTSATPKASAQPVSQIGDGQIQATTSTAIAKSTAQAVSQIVDGQIQASTATAQAVSQIGDGQIQASTATAQAVSQIGDGQIQASTATKSTGTAVSQLTDGQVQATKGTTTLSPSSTAEAGSSSNSSDNSGVDISEQACKEDGSLAMTLNGSILTDSSGRIGSIVANRQFQFDGPPPQAGAIYAAGWSITEEGNLAIGDNDKFYQCLSGTFYNLYDESQGSQCKEIHLEVVDLVSC